MAEKVKAWVLGIVGIVLLGMLADIIIAEGRTKKAVKGVFGLITLLVIISPIAELAKGGYNFVGEVVTGSVKPDERYLDTITKAQIEELSKAVTAKLASQGIKDAKVTFSVIGQTISLVYVDVSASGTDMWQKYASIKSIVAKHLNIEEGSVIVYG